jgi:hypothetical protein
VVPDRLTLTRGVSHDGSFAALGTAAGVAKSVNVSLSTKRARGAADSLREVCIGGRAAKRVVAYREGFPISDGQRRGGCRGGDRHVVYRSIPPTGPTGPPPPPPTGADVSATTKVPEVCTTLCLESRHLIR